MVDDEAGRRRLVGWMVDADFTFREAVTFLVLVGRLRRVTERRAG
jgi:hypothetical protein